MGNTCYCFPAAIPPLYVLSLALLTSHLPERDYWDQLPLMFGAASRGLTGLWNWLRFHNEHILFLPRVVYFVNVHLFGGSGRSLAFLAYGLAGLQMVLLLRALPDVVKTDTLLRAAAWLTISVMCFSPQAVEAWTWGMAGSQSCLSNLFVVMALLAFNRYSIGKQGKFLVLTWILTLLSILTAGSGLILTLVIGVLLVVDRASRFKLIMGLSLTAALWTVYVRGLATRNIGPPSSFTWDRIDLIGAAFFQILGGTLSSIPDIARITGVALAFILIAVAAGLISRPSALGSTNVMLWFGLSAYSLVLCLAIATARAPGGGMGSRHASIPALFWIGTAVCCMILMHEHQLLRPYRIVIAMTVGALSVGAFVNGVAHPVIQSRKERQLDRDLAAVSMRMGLLDSPLIRKAIHPVVQRFERSLPFAKQVHQYPFNSDFKSDCGLLGTTQPLDPALHLPAQPPLRGRFDRIALSSSGLVRVSGWLYAGGAAPECIIILDQSDHPRGVAVHGFSRPGLSNYLRTNSDALGWAGYLDAAPVDKTFEAVVKLQDDPHFYRLSGPPITVPPADEEGP